MCTNNAYVCVSWVANRQSNHTKRKSFKCTTSQTVSKQKNIIHHMDFIISLRLEWEAKLEVQTSKNRP